MSDLLKSPWLMECKECIIRVRPFLFTLSLLPYSPTSIRGWTWSLAVDARNDVTRVHTSRINGKHFFLTSVLRTYYFIFKVKVPFESIQRRLQVIISIGAFGITLKTSLAFAASSITGIWHIFANTLDVVPLAAVTIFLAFLCAEEPV